MAAAGVFAGTNLDDLVVLTVLFLSGRVSGRPRSWQVWSGQYMGFGFLVTVSAVVALGLSVVPDEWVGLLGLIPLILGARGMVAAVHVRGDERPPSPAVATGVMSIAGVTVANGGDNISGYTPLFRTIGPVDSVISVSVFVVGVALWCLAGSWLASHKHVNRVVQRFGHWLVPVVFMLLGALILLESGIFARWPGQ